MAKEKEFTLNDFLQTDNIKEAVRVVSFERGLKILEELVAQVESGTMPLDQTMTAYDHGAKLLEHLRALLSGAEEKLKILQKK